jgi:hypothetical protein
VNNGDNVPIGDLAQKLRCNICFPHVVLLVLIEKKTKGENRSLYITGLLGQIL